MKSKSAIVCLLLVAILVLLLPFCHPKIHAAKNVPVNPAFEMNPPIATEIQLRVLKKPIDGGNVLITSQFQNNSLKEKYLAVMVGDSKVVLHDDGLDGDAKANDGVFSIVVNENISFLDAELKKRRAKLIAAEKEGHLMVFHNRSGRKIEASELGTIGIGGLRDGIILHFPPGFFTGEGDDMLKDHSLMITNTNVTGDPSRTINPCTGAGTPNGAWTFERVLRELVNTPVTGVSVQDFLRNWLGIWLTTVTVNGFPTSDRALLFSDFIVPWLQKSGVTAPITTANWRTFDFDLRFAPFRLLAIVNRLDLRGNSGYGFSNAGEGRLIFGLVNLNNCTPAPGTFIFEYGINKTTCSSVVDFAQQWSNLKTMSPGTPEYNTALQAITDQFTLAGTNPSKPNGSSLDQVRTNEIAFTGPWEMRQFSLNATSHNIEESTISQEPSLSFNAAIGSPDFGATLADYVNHNVTDILNNSYEVPLVWPSGSSHHFLGALTQLDGAGGSLYWDADLSNHLPPPSPKITNAESRHIFSLGTCLGCHGGETKTGFTQVSPTETDPVTHGPVLSSFLTGLGADDNSTDDDADTHGLFYINDPTLRPSAAHPTSRGFNDLERRARDLESLTSGPCAAFAELPVSLLIIEKLQFKPVHMTH